MCKFLAYWNSSSLVRVKTFKKLRIVPWLLQKCVAWGVYFAFQPSISGYEFKFQDDFLANGSFAGQFQVWFLWEFTPMKLYASRLSLLPHQVLYICIVLNIVENKWLYSIIFKYTKFIFLVYSVISFHGWVFIFFIFKIICSGKIFYPKI